MNKPKRILYLDKRVKNAEKVAKLLDRYISSGDHAKDYKAVTQSDSKAQFKQLEKVLSKHFNLEYLGGGCSRTVYKLTNNLVLKINRYGGKPTDTYLDYNGNELEASLGNEQAARPYLHYVDTVSKVDVLISQRARCPYNSYAALDKMPLKLHKQYKELTRKYNDIHYNNIGLIGKRVVAIDLGH